jgi:hypothetical protein
MLLAAMSAFTARGPEHAQVRSLVDALLAVFGTIALAYVVLRGAIDWERFDWRLAWQKLALPVWVTFGSPRGLGEVAAAGRRSPLV